MICLFICHYIQITLINASKITANFCVNSMTFIFNLPAIISFNRYLLL
ncbi:hypothetical protein J537_1855 [Acinetobacter baumannii 1437282]|nr:hypothetical protein J537_1855 [Acinetobacter baumannii 1437282]